MAKRDTNRVCGGVHQENGRAMRLPTAEDLEACYWGEYYLQNPNSIVEEADGEVVFAPGTPQRVIDSYKLWEEKRAAKKQGQ